MSAHVHLQSPHQNVVLTDVFAQVDELLKKGSVTQINSVVLWRPRDTAASLLKLKGLGAEIWTTEDPQRYIDRLRNEWEK